MFADPPVIQLTTKDHDVLRSIMSSGRAYPRSFFELLDHKLRHGMVFLRDDIPPRVVTLNTRLTYFIDGRSVGPRLVVQAPPPGLPDYAVSIHTLTGLALLGLAEGGVATMRAETGETLVLRIDEVLSQPEAEATLQETGRYLASGSVRSKAGPPHWPVAWREPTVCHPENRDAAGAPLNRTRSALRVVEGSGNGKSK